MNNYSGQRLFDSWYIPDFNNPLGRGSFGVVYELLSYNEIMKPTAVKIISIPASEQEYATLLNEVDATREDVNTKLTKTKDKLLNEIAIMLQVSGHSNCVSCMSYCVIQHEGCFGWDVLIQMEKLTSLDSYYRRKGVITNTDIIRLGMDMCSALTICKANNIIHRDIKPANIMVKELGETVYYKLMNVGMAHNMRFVESTVPIADVLDYVAPELLMGEGDARVDIYSLGMVLYELLNANRMPFIPDYPAPYTGEDEGRARMRREHGETLPEPLYASGTLLGRIIKKACAYKPEDRYQSAQEMQDALKQALSEERERVIFMVPPVGRYEPTERKKRENAPKEPKLQPEQTKKEEPKEEPELKPTKKVEVKEKPTNEERKTEPVRKKPNSGKKGKTPLLIAAACAAVVLIAVLAAAFGGNTTQNSQASVQSTTAETTENKAEATAEATEEATKSALEIAYKEACALSDSGEAAKAAIAFGKLGDYKDAKEKSFALWDEVAVRNTIAAGYAVAGLKTDGTVIAVGGEESGASDVGDWTDIVAVSCGNYASFGLKADGTVVTAGQQAFGECELDDWSGIVAISAGCYYILGVKADGTVAAAGDPAMIDGVTDWADIIAVSGSYTNIYGLKADGTVVHYGGYGVYTLDTDADKWLDINADEWSDIIAISTNEDHTIALKADGTVAATGSNQYGQCDVEDWSNIVAVSAGCLYSVGLQADGTVVATGWNEWGECNVTDWTDIVAIATYNSAGSATVGLKADGTVVITGSNYDVSSWSNIKLPEER